MDRRDDFERDDDRDFHGGDRFERRSFVRRISRKDVPYVDYKDLEFLSKALTPQGKLLNRRKTGADAKMQHELRRAIMRARFMALIPYGS